MSTTITTLGEWIDGNERHEIVAVACPISTIPEFNDGADLQVFTLHFTVATDEALVPHLAALWAE